MGHWNSQFYKKYREQLFYDDHLFMMTSISVVESVSLALYRHKTHFLDWVTEKLDFLNVTVNSSIQPFYDDFDVRRPSSKF